LLIAKSLAGTMGRIAVTVCANVLASTDMTLLLCGDRLVPLAATALYAHFARLVARPTWREHPDDRRIVTVRTRWGRREKIFEKGEADGTADALAVLGAIVNIEAG